MDIKTRKLKKNNHDEKQNKNAVLNLTECHNDLE